MPLLSDRTTESCTPLTAPLSRKHRFLPYQICESGVEHMTVQLPPMPFATDGWGSNSLASPAGRTGILLSSQSNAWVQSVDVVNADIGIQLERCEMTTVKSVNIISGEEEQKGIVRAAVDIQVVPCTVVDVRAVSQYHFKWSGRSRGAGAVGSPAKHIACCTRGLITATFPHPL